MPVSLTDWHYPLMGLFADMGLRQLPKG